MVIFIVAKRTLGIKFHHPTCQTPEMRKIATHNFFDFYIFKKRDLTNLFVVSQYSIVFLFRFVSIELVSLI